MILIASGIQRHESTHWYKRDGTPFYEVIAKGNGQPRSATLRDARPVGAVPSFSTVNAILDKPNLNGWKVEQGILAALTAPHLPGETLTEFAARCAQDAADVSIKAADFGTAVHDAIESFIGGALESPRPDVVKFVEAFKGWYDAHIQELRGCIVDWKTQGKQTLDALAPWDDWCRQLAAYRAGAAVAGTLPETADPLTEQTFADLDHGYGGKLDFLWRRMANQDIGALVLVNVLISSAVPGLIKIHRWPEPEAEKQLDIFKHTLALWKILKGYDASTFGKEMAAC